MRSNLLRAAAVFMALAAPVMTASAAFAQSQAVPSFTDATGVTHYGYFSKGSQVDAALQPSIQQSGSALARGLSTIRTDAGSAAIANDPFAAANPHLYNAEALLNREGGNAW